MKSWLIKAKDFLRGSLEPPKHEVNELDWKASLSSDKKRLAEHLSALANYPGGGFLVFGVSNEGAPIGLSESQIETTINQLANLGRDALIPQVALDHAVDTFEAGRLLFVHVPESNVKPVHLRGKSLDSAFIRSGGTTRLASHQEIGSMMLHSRTPRWEELHASMLLSEAELLSGLNIEPILKMLMRPLPSSPSEILTWMEEEKFVDCGSSNGGYVTNLGAMAAARKLTEFADLGRKAVRVVVYDGLNKAKTKQEREGTMGYAIASKAS